MTFKKSKNEPPFFSFFAMLEDPLEAGICTFDESIAFIASTGKFRLVGLTAFEDKLGEEGPVDVEKRGVVGMVEGEAVEEVETAFSESLVFIELVR